MIIISHIIPNKTNPSTNTINGNRTKTNIQQIILIIQILIMKNSTPIIRPNSRIIRNIKLIITRSQINGHISPLNKSVQNSKNILKLLNTANINNPIATLRKKTPLSHNKISLRINERLFKKEIPITAENNSSTMPATIQRIIIHPTPRITNKIQRIRLSIQNGTRHMPLPKTKHQRLIIAKLTTIHKQNIIIMNNST